MADALIARTLESEGKGYFVVRKFAYLRTPTYSVTWRNAEGGSFSNGSGFRTLKQVAGHIWTGYRHEVLRDPSTRVLVETWEGFDANDVPVTTDSLTDVDALLSRSGVTR
jgi:hypothetical protein